MQVNFMMLPGKKDKENQNIQQSKKDRVKQDKPNMININIYPGQPDGKFPRSL